MAEALRFSLPLFFFLSPSSIYLHLFLWALYFSPCCRPPLSEVKILPQSLLRSTPGPVKTRWNAQTGAAGQLKAGRSFLRTTFVEVGFIYTAASHNKSYLMTLSKYSSSRYRPDSSEPTRGDGGRLCLEKHLKRV